MKWNNYCHHRCKDKKWKKKGKNTLFCIYNPHNHLWLVIMTPLLRWGNKTCLGWQRHKVRTKTFNSESDLVLWVQRSIFYSYVYHLPISSTPTGRVSLKCISGDHMHMAQGSPVFGSLMSNGDIYFCLLQSLIPWLALSPKGKDRLEAKQGKSSTALDPSCLLYCPVLIFGASMG